jgi:hypothetical protein
MRRRIEMVILKNAEEPKIWVRGAEDTSDLECEVCDGWLNHWKKLKGISNDVKVNCCHPRHKKTGNKKADRGAHVIKTDTPEDKAKIELSQTDISDIMSEKLFIIPVCEEHNITGGKSILIPKRLLADAKPCKREKEVRIGLKRNINVR